MNLGGAEQLIITTSTQEAIILKLPDLAETAKFKLSSTASVSFAPSSCPNTIFFGLVSPGQFGQASASIQIVLPGKEIVEPNAHTA